MLLNTCENRYVVRGIAIYQTEEESIPKLPYGWAILAYYDLLEKTIAFSTCPHGSIMQMERWKDVSLSLLKVYFMAAFNDFFYTYANLKIYQNYFTPPYGRS